MKKIIVLGAAFLLAAATLTGCGTTDLSKYTEPYQDSPRGPADNSPATIINMPDGWGNIATKCVGDIRYSSLYHNNNPYGAVSMVVDPECKH